MIFCGAVRNAATLTGYAVVLREATRSMISIPLWLAVAVSIGLIAIGVYCLLCGRRGRVIHDHPLCAQCGYDLIGQPSDSNRCPECGASLTTSYAVRVGARESRPMLLVAGNFLLLCGVAIVILWFAGVGRSINWISIKPVWWLASDAERMGAGTNPCLQELNRRLGLGKINAANAHDVVERALRIQNDPTAAWNPGWGDFIEGARGCNYVTDKEWKRYAEQTIKHTLHFFIRKRIAIGDPIPRKLQIDKRAASNSVLFAEIKFRGRFKIDNITIGTEGFSISQFNLGTQNMASSSSVSSICNSNIKGVISPGRWKATTDVDVDIWEDASGYFDKNKPVVFSGQLNLSDELEVLPEGESTIELVTNDSWRPEQTFWIELHKAEGNGTRQMYLHSDNSFTVADIAYEVFLAADEHEYRVGTISRARSSRSNSNTWVLELPSSIPTHYDEFKLILRPDISAAKNDVDIFQLWGKAVEIENVYVQDAR